MVKYLELQNSSMIWKTPKIKISGDNLQKHTPTYLKSFFLKNVKKYNNFWFVPLLIYHQLKNLMHRICMRKKRQQYQETLYD